MTIDDTYIKDGKLNIKLKEYGYEDLCSCLGEDCVEPGNKRSAQYSRWRRYFEWSKPTRYSYLITEIYKDPKVKKNGKKRSTAAKKMTREEIAEWDELYSYVKYEILGLDENMRMPKDAVCRLKGMREGKFMANNAIKSTADYPYKVILTTFKFCKPDIIRAFASNTFNDERHRLNYALKVVENNLNTVYTRMQKAKRSEEKLKSMDMSIATYEGADYKKKTHETPSKLNNLW